jgi:hypothetical protein
MGGDLPISKVGGVYQCSVLGMLRALVATHGQNLSVADTGSSAQHLHALIIHEASTDMTANTGAVDQILPKPAERVVVIKKRCHPP